jgi:sucrose-phosphate synthase
MFIVHLAFQGCLRGQDVAYGLTADTGGHIRYLLDLVQACAQDTTVDRIVIATRLFAGAHGDDYAMPEERISGKASIVRFASTSPGYLPKEALHGEVASLSEALIAWIAAQPVRPDVIHAHYADAAVVAARVEDRLGIPFVFTAHSLGRVKARASAVSSAAIRCARDAASGARCPSARALTRPREWAVNTNGMPRRSSTRAATTAASA